MPVRILVALVLAATSWLVAPTGAVSAATDCTINGTRGDDVLTGTRGADVICGRGGDDRLVGRGGDDVLRGGPGDDSLRGGRGADVLRCGAGTDRVSADARDDVDASCDDTDEGSAITGIELDPAAVAENASAGTVVGQLTAVGADPDEPITFTLELGDGSADNAAFAIDAAALTTVAPLDHEETPTLSIRVSAATATGSRFATALTIEVTDADDPAVAVDDAATVAESPAATTIPVLANDSDPDSALTVASVTRPANGTATVAAGGGAVSYQPSPGFCGTDTFGYALVGGATATVTVTVSCVDDAPRAVDDTATVTEDAAATAVPVLTNDTDSDGGTKRIASVTQPTHGTVVITGGGAGLTYEPDAGECGPDEFTYTLNGGSTATVDVAVTL